MKKMGKGILMLGIIAMFSATGVAAAGNSVTTFYFSANGTPQISIEKDQNCVRRGKLRSSILPKRLV